MPDPAAGPWCLCAALSTPVVVTDAAYRIVFFNRSAESQWELPGGSAIGGDVWAALRIAPPCGTSPARWLEETVGPGLDLGTPIPCLTAAPDGITREVRLCGLRVLRGGSSYVVLSVGPPPGEAAPVGGDPEWALRDPLTGLYNLHRWRREFARWDARAGTVLLLDLDDLKEINDLYGHQVGDRALATSGRAFADHAPPGALAVRYGGDEFLLVCEESDPGRAASMAERIAHSAADEAQEVGLPLPLRLSYGLARYEAGALQRAVHQADEAMYERKGVLLRGSGAGRIVLTRSGRERVRMPGADPTPQPSRGEEPRFGPDWDLYFRQAFARAVDHAREFVAFVQPDPGMAVVEVGAGSGRITFDGGLAERIGLGGQLLVTDPSVAQIEVARRRAESLGLTWLRFLQAPVEDLPLAAGTVDLVLGSTFLHFTDPAVALRAMARVVRPGGAVAVNAPVRFRWGPAWEEILAPVREERALHGLPMRGFLPERDEVEAAFAGAGLTIERGDIVAGERADCPSAEIALQIVRQATLVRLMLRGVPAERHAPVEDAVETRLRGVFAGGVSPDDVAGWSDTLSLLGRRSAC